MSKGMLTNETLTDLAIAATDDAAQYDKKTAEVHVAVLYEKIADCAKRIVKIRGGQVKKKAPPKAKPAMVTGLDNVVVEPKTAIAKKPVAKPKPAPVAKKEEEKGDDK